MKKKGYWVLLGVMVLVGALLIANYYFQRVPVVPDVNAQMSQFDNMGSYVSTGSYSMGSIGAYAGSLSYGQDTALYCSGRTSSTCGFDCGWTSRTCFICDGSQTSLNCSDSIFMRYTEGMGKGKIYEPVTVDPTKPSTIFYGYTSLLCPTPTLFGSSTFTGLTCPGGSTGLFGMGGTTCLLCTSICCGTSQGLFGGLHVETAYTCSKGEACYPVTRFTAPFLYNSYGFSSATQSPAM